MATTKRLFVFSTSFLSGIATLFLIISVSTEQWIVCNDARYTRVIAVKDAVVKYGLFQGTIVTQYPSPRTLVLSMTCLAKKGVCAMLCASDADGREILLEKLYNDESASQDDEKCPSVDVAHARYDSRMFRNTGTGNDGDKKFINFGVWVSTLVFLFLAIIFGAVSSGLAIYNTVSNPVEVLLSIYGLYIYNAIAACSSVLAMTLWGVAHLFTTFHDVATFYSLTGNLDTDGRANLGYSFWILLIPVFLYFGSVCVLYARHYLISKEPGQKVLKREEPADSLILF